MKILLCTQNKYKAEEFAHLLPGLEIDLMDQNIIMPPESADTYEGNARIKADFGRSIDTNTWVLADDSGLEITALGNNPGVKSARFAGENSTIEQNKALVFEKLKTHTQESERRAKFICVLILVSPTGEEFITRGESHGYISLEPSHRSGFGYDPMFIPDGHNKTYTSLDHHIKMQISHRARACKNLLEILSYGA